MSSTLDWIDEALARIDASHLRRTLTARLGSQGATIVVDHQRLLNFGSNDYLGLANDPRVLAAVRSALDESGWGSGASPLVSGRSHWHAQLERDTASLEQAESALVFPTGYAANVGTITALVGPGDVILSDAKNHASIIDGCRLSGARIIVFPHNDIGAVTRLLGTSGEFRRRLIVSDSLFSMDGDFARLAELTELARAHNAMLMIDEAHATGVFGTHGRGIAELQRLEDRIDIRVGTLSKALGSLGGFVAGSRRLIDWLVHRARPYVFSTAAPAALCAAAIKALEIVRDEPFRRDQLLANAAYLRDRLARQGWHVGQSPSQIIPIYVTSAERATEWSRRFRDSGIFLPGIRPPTVPAGESLLRISLSYAHSRAGIEQLLECCARFRTTGSDEDR
jgi:8-amino-7-oxononanoate synthase